MSAGSIVLETGSAPATPATNLVALYPKTDGLLYWKDDSGTERRMTTSDGTLAIGAGDTLTVPTGGGTALLTTSNLDASNLTGTVADARLSGNVPRLDVQNTFTAYTRIGGSGAPASMLHLEDNTVAGSRISIQSTPGNFPGIQAMFDGNALRRTLLRAAATGTQGAEWQMWTKPNTGGMVLQRLTITDSGAVLVGKSSGLSGPGDLDVAGVARVDTYLDLTEQGSSPASPGAGFGRLFVDQSGGKSRLRVRFDGGIVTLATEP